MSNPKTLSYTLTHEWMTAPVDGVCRVGLTDFAQSELGDIVFVDLPQQGDRVTAGVSFGDVESVKAISEMISPVTGTVLSINEAVADAPELINSDPYGTWLLEIGQIEGTEPLLDADAYEAACKG